MEQAQNEIYDKVEDTERVQKEIKIKAAKRANTRAKVNSWDLDTAILLFIIPILVTILIYKGIGIGIVALIAILGFTYVWLVGYRKRKRKIRLYYEEELVNIVREILLKAHKEDMLHSVEEIVEECMERVLLEEDEKLKSTKSSVN